MEMRPNMTVLEARRTTLADFEVMAKAHQKREFENLFNLHLSAWLHNQVKATDERGKPYYKEFQEFFDYEERLAMVDDRVKKQKENEISEHKKLMEMIKRVNA